MTEARRGLKRFEHETAPVFAACRGDGCGCGVGGVSGIVRPEGGRGGRGGRERAGGHRASRITDKIVRTVCAPNCVGSCGINAYVKTT